MGAAKAAFVVLILVAFFLTLAPTSSAINITRILAEYPEYGTFRDLLIRTQIDPLINKRLTITVLALNNDSMSSIADRSTDQLKNILMNHIVLDYFDMEKIRHLGRKSQLLTTLYQTTGMAQNQQGFINLTRVNTGNVVFGPAERAAPLVSKLLGSVYAQPFNVSVLHVSLPIIASGFGDPVLAPPPPPFTAPPPAAPSPKKAPAPSDQESDDTGNDYSAPETAPSPAPEADAPAADAPKKKSPHSPKDADQDEEAPHSASSRVSVDSSMAIAVLMGLGLVAN